MTREYFYIYPFVWDFQLSKWAENSRLVREKLQTSDFSMVPTKTLTVCTFTLKCKALAWSPAQTACINKACRRKCDVRVGFDRFVSGEIPSVWCRFSNIVTFEGFSLGLQQSVSSCLFVTHWSWDGVELEKSMNESAINCVTDMQYEWKCWHHVWFSRQIKVRRIHCHRVRHQGMQLAARCRGSSGISR